ncbi:hypothetical protein BGW36DRAFT_371110 [Talaromyces proteolyticus]|uniref:Zn(2)-C6 fungal-type domain-containing protein n=1 Tax=Talaromyces proteolyticus TaxID=1131652 RepID=A0AAD4KUP3_9EURO|nr:uncharacterized protein BGW36DRAFT_371110 [Talaromyces proteolyticus]KAH8701563.1 hypothetical protein BGW36DRAFT_371110 [Talaromyces proteolyticus]
MDSIQSSQHTRQGKDEATRSLRKPSTRVRVNAGKSSNSGVRNIKLPTRRISRACDLCRLKKLRCNGVHPTCEACSISGQDCTYGIRAKKRGLPTGYVRILEALWGIVFEVIPDSMSTVLQLLQNADVVLDHDDKVTLSSHHVTSADGLRQIWARSSVRRAIDERVLEIEKGEGLLQQTKTTDTSLSSSNFPRWEAPLQIPSDNLGTSPKDTGSVAIGREMHHQNYLNTTNILLEDGSCVLEGSGFQKKSMLSLPVDAWSLVDAYSQYINAWLPIIPKHHLVRILSSYEDGSHCSVPEIALMWAVFALASSEMRKDTTNVNETQRSRRYYHHALKLTSVDNITDTSNLHLVFIILAMLDMSENKWHNASMLTGNAVRYALVVNTRVGVSSLSARKDFGILGAFVMDTLISARIEALPHLRSNDIRQMIEFDVQGQEEWDQSPGCQQPLRSLSTFKEYIKLLMILNDYTCYLWQSNHVAASKLSLSLESWVFNLPRHCNFGSASPGSDQQLVMSLPVANLGLAFDIVFFYIQAGAQTDLLARPVSEGSHRNVSRLKEAYVSSFQAFQWRGILSLHRHAFSIKDGSSASLISDSPRLGIEQKDIRIISSDVATPERLGGQKSIGSLIDELSSIHDGAEYDTQSSQFMWDLGFYDQNLPLS